MMPKKMKKNKIKDIVFQIALVLILIGASSYLFVPLIAPYILLVGVAAYGAITFTTPYPGKSIRGKRLFNIQIFSVLAMIVATYLMFVNIKQWVVAMFIAAILTLYCAYLIPSVWKKEQEENESKKK